MANYAKGFGPHYWERCYVFRCRKGECPFVTHCFAAEAEDRKETRELVQSLYNQATRGEEESPLTASQRARLDHARRKYPAVFASPEASSY